ncbi:MAG: endonuclease/exonuclease/phosphatase family protein [Planctomycetota bacterium]|nr:endonuclease/exonuclease/phosphatase family protein [Planctomycetota bacterium]
MHLLAWTTTASADEPAGSRLRIVTFNAQCLAAPETRDSKLPRFRWEIARRRHVEHVANIIEALEPDVMALQEVTSKPVVQLLLEVLAEKGLDQYRAYHVESQDKFSGFDVAFVTRFKAEVVDGQPIRIMYSPSGDATWRESFSFTDEDGQQRERETALIRHALFCVNAQGLKLGFLGVHLKADPSDDYANVRRTAEAHIARRIVQREIVARGYTPIVLGDLNDYDPDVPDRDPTRSTKTNVLKLLKDYDQGRPGDELVNAAERIVRVADRFTSHWDINENFTSDEGDVFTMIDHILLHKSLAPKIRRTFVCRIGDLKTSDHWPLVVDLNLP